MWDLGFPTAIDVVTLYARATKVKWGPDYTDAIPVDRGSTRRLALTVPLPIYIEPLLRWLHVGSSYMHGCLAQKTMD
jgi:hypothetical protein